MLIAGAVFDKTTITAIHAPKKVTTKAVNFNDVVRLGSIIVGKNIQLSLAPLVTAPRVKIIIGVVINLSMSDVV